MGDELVYSAQPDGPDRSHRLRPEQVGEMISEARELLDTLEDGLVVDEKSQERGLNVYGLLDWAKASRGDGYPTASISDGSPRGSVTDEHHVPMPPVNDPVGELVIAGANPVQRSATDVRRRVRTAVGELRAAVTSLVKADRPAPATAAEPGCRSCWRRKVWSAVFRVTKTVRVVNDKGEEEFVEQDVPLCRWCYDWNAAHKADPPLEILQLHHEGRRITDRFVREVMGRKRKRSA